MDNPDLIPLNRVGATINATADLTDLEPLSALARLSAVLHRGGWATLSDRVLDIRSVYRERVLAHQYTSFTRKEIVRAELAALADGFPTGRHCMICGEPEGSTYEGRCCDPEQMVS